MTTSRVNFSKLEWECINLCNTLNEFIEKMKSERHLFPRFFNNNHEETRIASSFLNEVRKITSISTFPNLPFYEENKFISSINDFYKKLISKGLEKISNKQNIDTDLMDFLIKISADLKAVIKVFFIEISDVNLSYLNLYFSSREAGFDIPTNSFILKTETINALKHYLNNSNNRNLCKILKSAYDDLMQVTSHGENFQNQFAIVLQTINNLRLKLIDSKEDQFLVVITEIMDNALEIVRSRIARGWKIQNSLMINSCDPIVIKLVELEHRNRKNKYIF